MKTLFTVVLTLLTLGTIQGQNPVFDADRLSEINKWIEKDVKNGELQGAIVMISDKNNILYSFVGGTSDIETKRKLQKNDFFKIASMTKVITTVAILQLYEKGLFDLSDPISKYLPEFKDVKVLRSEENKTDTLVNANSEVTIKQLLNQTAGYAYGGPKISKRYKENNIRFFNPEGSNLEEFMQQFSKMPLTAQPGEKFTYGPSTDILGYLIEKLTNKDLETYYKESIFEPLEMYSTGFNAHRSETIKLVKTYKIDKTGTLVLLNKAEDFDKNKTAKVYMGGSGLISTAEDYLKFCQMLLNNGNYKNVNIVSRKSIELMTQNQIQDLVYPKGYNRILGKGNTFGFGVNVVTEKGSMNELYSIGSYFWEGSYSTSFIIDPKEGFTAIIMTQIGGLKSLDIRKKFRKFVYSALK
ncbi:serine hydrolase domain-containing protein [Kordia sp.]|uniref:serine hydrolase domain-containing protein n=1 Tax=Kordia sp. TaxID=1965332 RepID=UPI003D2E91CB